MTEDHAIAALEAIKAQIGAEIPTRLLEQILEIEKRYAFDHDEASSALREIEAIVDAVIRGGEKS